MYREVKPSLNQRVVFQMVETGNGDFLEYNIYLTRGWGPNMVSFSVYVQNEATVIIRFPVSRRKFRKAAYSEIDFFAARAWKRRSFFCGYA